MLIALGVVVALYVALSFYLAVVLRWEDEQTVGLNYYGRSLEGRRRFKRTLRRHATVLSPILWLNSRIGTLDFRKARIVHKGISAPTGSCSVESFAAAESYRPRPEDVFVVTQMKSGTTWMQHVVYQILTRGKGTLVESGTALYAIAPWIEGRKSVPVNEAPLVGTERPSRIMKTHLPAALCPYDAAARYIYVVRHPASCFASCVDFVATNVGGMAPPLAVFEEWFCAAELMWWGAWPDHVSDWWRRSRGASNVLFVRFEDMAGDLPAVVREVATFLGMPELNKDEVRTVVQKCSFTYMQEHQEVFEMHPPHVLHSGASLFVSGSAERHLDVPDAVRGRVMAWAAEGLAASEFPLAEAYPDVAAAR